jgi:integrase
MISKLGGPVYQGAGKRPQGGIRAVWGHGESVSDRMLAEYKPNGNIWGIFADGISTMLKRLAAKTGITCNPHNFRRTFAVMLRKIGIDNMTIKELGRWESLEMVQRYTRSFSFQDSMKFYKSPLSN